MYCDQQYRMQRIERSSDARITHLLSVACRISLDILTNAVSVECIFYTQIALDHANCVFPCAPLI